MEPGQVDFDRKFDQHLRVLGDVLENYERDNPTWFTQTVLSLIRAALQSLRHYIDDPSDEEIDWPNAVAEIRYPIKWNWDAWNGKDSTGPIIKYGTMTHDDLNSSDRAAEKLTSIAVEHVNTFVLLNLTNQVGYEKCGDGYIPVGLPDAQAELHKTKSPKRKRRKLNSLLEPFSLGCFRFDIESKSKSIAEAHNNWRDMVREHVSAPIRLQFRTQAGELYRFSIVVEINPFVIEPNTREAYYPIIAGIVFDPPSDITLVDDRDAIDDTNWPNPNNWTSADREKLWEHIFRHIDSLIEPLGESPSVSHGETVVTVNAKLILPTHSLKESPIPQLLNALSKEGRVVEFRSAVCDSKDFVNTPTSCGDSAPNSLSEAILRLIWSKKYRLWLLAPFALLIAIFSIWVTLPDKNKSSVFQWLFDGRTETVSPVDND